MANDGAISAHLVVTRFQQLLVGGAPAVGAATEYRQKAVKVDYKPKVSGGNVVKITAGDGSLCYTDVEPLIVEAADVEVTVCGDDPEFTFLLLGGVLSTGTPAVTRTLNDAVFTQAATLPATNPGTLNSATGAFVAGDVGKTVTSTTYTQLPAGTTIVSITSATVAVLSSPVPVTSATNQNATVFTPGTVNGYSDPAFGQIGRPTGTSLEWWADASIGGNLASDTLPSVGGRIRHVIPKCLWSPPNRTYEFGAPVLLFKGVVYANSSWTRTDYKGTLPVPGGHGYVRETTSVTPLPAIGLQPSIA